MKTKTQKDLDLELDLEAREYENKTEYSKYVIYNAYVSGASGKHVEKEKLLFAIEQLNSLKSCYEKLAIYRGTIKECVENRIKELEQNYLNEL
jgi:hypothetical protein